MKTEDSTLRLRPRFKKRINLKTEEVKQKILASLRQSKDQVAGKIVDNHVILKIPKDQQHYWSPQLTLELSQEKNETILRGLFGPKPGVWTMFVFFYSAIGFLTMMGLIFGLSQMMLKMNAYGLWSFPVGATLLLSLFGISKIGQKLSREQMHQLNSIIQVGLHGHIQDE